LYVRLLPLILAGFNMLMLTCDGMSRNRDPASECISL
jgi:hypothetical protein